MIYLRHRQGQHKFSTVSAIQEIPDSCPYRTLTSTKLRGLERSGPVGAAVAEAGGLVAEAGGSPNKFEPVF